RTHLLPPRTSSPPAVSSLMMGHDHPTETPHVLHYPKLEDSSAAQLGPCVAFDKIDGTNLHWDWDRDFGWHAFGTRRDLFDLTPAGIEAFHAAHPGLADCVDLFRANFAGPLERIFREHADFGDFPEAKAFTEYAGPNSFAGQHQPGD